MAVGAIVVAPHGLRTTSNTCTAQVEASRSQSTSLKFALALKRETTMAPRRATNSAAGASNVNAAQQTNVLAVAFVVR
jgi:hypothetical protein